jgi:hypothetical protein
VYQRVFTLSSVFIGLISCSDNTAGSTDVESGGQIAGVVKHLDGTIADGTEVWLISSDPTNPVNLGKGNSIILNDDTADNQGVFIFDSVPAGSYRLEAFHSGAKTRFLSTEINLLQDDSIQIEQTLHTPSRIEVEANEATAIGDWIYINGSVHSKTWDSIAVEDGVLGLDSIPAGVELELFSNQGSQTAPELITDSLILNPGDTIKVSL